MPRLTLQDDDNIVYRAFLQMGKAEKIPVMADTKGLVPTRTAEDQVLQLSRSLEFNVTEF